MHAMHPMTATARRSLSSSEDVHLEVVARLARGLAEGVDVQVAFSERQWSWHPSSRTLRVAREDLRWGDMAYCAALVAHEIGHCAISRYLDFADETCPAGWRSPQWAELLNVLEDPRVEGWMMREFPGSRAWFCHLHATHRAECLPTEMPSLTLRFYLAALREWHHGWQPVVSGHAAVDRALDLTRASRHAYATCWPERRLPRAVREHGIDASAREAMVHTATVLAALDALRDAEVRALGQQLAGSLRLRTLAETAVRDIDGAACTSLLQASHGRVADDTAIAQDVLALAHEVVRCAELKAPSKLRVRPFRVDRRCSSGPASEGRGRRLGDGHGGAPPWLQQLTRHAQQAATARASRVSALAMLRRELAGIFPPILPIQWSREHPSGRRLDLRKASQLPVDPQAALQLWQRRSSPERPDAAVLLLVDLSGSMANGGRIEAAVLAASTCAEVLREMAIPCAVVGFQDRTIAIAGFDEPWTDSLQRRIGEMALEVSETRPGGNNRAGHNDDGPCLLDAAAQLLQRPEHNRVLIVVSDGRPAGRRSGSADLRRAVAQLSDRPMALAAIGIGRGTRHVASYYPEAHGDVPIGAFPAVLARTMARRLRAGERNRGA